MSEEENEEGPEFRSIPKFDRDYDQMRAQGKHERINEGLQKIQEDPQGNSHHLKGEFKGKRSHRVGDYRILFADCQECIERGDTEHNACDDCEELHGENHEDPEDIIKLFETGDRPNVYD